MCTCVHICVYNLNLILTIHESDNLSPSPSVCMASPSPHTALWERHCVRRAPRATSTTIPAKNAAPARQGPSLFIRPVPHKEQVSASNAGICRAPSTNRKQARRNVLNVQLIQTIVGQKDSLVSTAFAGLASGAPMARSARNVTSAQSALNAKVAFRARSPSPGTVIGPPLTQTELFSGFPLPSPPCHRSSSDAQMPAHARPTIHVIGYTTTTAICVCNVTQVSIKF